jgi:magnesium-protoporphyrin IX monomethyl ester (oxidative) cyclase
MIGVNTDRSGNFLDADLVTADLSKIPRKKITLIACPWIFYNEVEFRSQQLGLGYVGAYAQKFGHEIIAFIDPMIKGGELMKTPLQTKYQAVNRCGYSDEEITAQIPQNTDIIGVNAPFTDSRLVLYPLIKKIKAAFPNVPVAVGGILATTLPRQVIEESGADIVVKGEGEIAFARICNGEPLEAIPGLVFRRSSGEIFENPRRSQQLKNINSIPPPGYDFRPMEEYVQWSPRGDKNDRTLSVISSRGCPFTCEFCSIPEKGQLWRPFTPERVLAEIKTAMEKWGVNHIEFEDDNFTLLEPRALKVLEFIRDLRRKGQPVSCSFPNGIMIDRMTKDLAMLFKEAGADIIYLPVESGDTRVLISMDKPKADTHLDKALEVARWCIEAKLFVSCFFIVAYPGGEITRKKYLRSEYEPYFLRDGDRVYMRGEDEAAFEKTLEFCRRLRNMGVQGIAPLIATPYPGTEMYAFCERFGYLVFPDSKDVLTTVSYAAVKPGLVQIETPWCSRQRVYDRWKTMMEMFPTYHNVRRFDDDQLLSGEEIRNR